MNTLLEHHLKQIQTEGDVVSDAHKEYMVNAKRKCNQFKGDEKKLCILRAKVEAKKAQLTKLKKIAGECRTAQNPNECHRTILKKAQKIRDSVNKDMLKYREAAVRVSQKKAKSQ